MDGSGTPAARLVVLLLLAAAHGACVTATPLATAVPTPSAPPAHVSSVTERAHAALARGQSLIGRGEMAAAVVALRQALALESDLTAARGALGKALDIELAIMLHTYREDLLAQQSRVERLSTFGQLVGSIGHELRNPLGVIETSLFILRNRTKGDERAVKHVERISEQLAIANSIITDLLDMIREEGLAVVMAAQALASNDPVEVQRSPTCVPVFPVPL